MNLVFYSYEQGSGKDGRPEPQYTTAQKDNPVFLSLWSYVRENSLFINNNVLDKGST